MRTKMTPQLRFPEFTDKWQVKKLGDIAVKVSDRNNATSASTVLTNSAVHGVIPQTDFFDKEIAVQGNLSNYYKTELDDFVYNPRISTSAPVGPFKRNNYGSGVLSPLYNLYRFRGGQVLTFFEQYLKSIHWHKYMKDVANYGARSDRMAISSADLLALPLPYPSKPEQEKIADFLTAVDERIGVGEKKLELLEAYKRGVMQKIFTQQIRFKDENGSSYPDWEEKKLGSFIRDFKQSSTIQDEYPVMTSSRKGIILQKDYYGDDNRITERSNVGYNVLPPKYLTYRSRSDDGRFRFNLNTTNATGIVSYFYPVFDIKSGNVKFFEEYLNYNWRILYKYSVGTSQKVLSHTELKNIRFDIPVIEEQQKIANFLAALDEKITAEKSKLTATRQFKKALLQRMFV